MGTFLKLILMVSLYFSFAHGYVRAEDADKQPVATADPSGKPKPVIHKYQMYPDIITNLSNENTDAYVRLRVQVVLEGKKSLDVLQEHEPILRDDIILLLNQRSRFSLKSEEGLAEFNKIVMEYLNNKLKVEEPTFKIREVHFDRLIVE